MLILERSGWTRFVLLSAMAVLLMAQAERGACANVPRQCDPGREAAFRSRLTRNLVRHGDLKNSHPASGVLRCVAWLMSKTVRIKCLRRRIGRRSMAANRSPDRADSRAAVGSAQPRVKR